MTLMNAPMYTSTVERNFCGDLFRGPIGANHGVNPDVNDCISIEI